MAIEWLPSGYGLAIEWYSSGVKQLVQISVYGGFSVEVSVCVRGFVMCYQYSATSSSGTHSKIPDALSLLTVVHSSRVPLPFRLHLAITSRHKPACRRQYVRRVLHPVKTGRTLLHYVKQIFVFSFFEASQNLASAFPKP